MIEIGLNQIVLNYGYKNVLDGAGFEVMTGERVDLVGRNGSGKSSILKIIAGVESPTSGSVSLHRGSTVGYLEQIPSIPAQNASTRQVLMQPFEEVAAAEVEMRRLEAAMADPAEADRLEALLEEYQEVQNRFAALDGYAVEETFSKITTGFGLLGLLEQPFSTLSGGQKTIVKLAATILRSPSILLLDEPTNHLDVNALEWFEGFLAKYRGTVVVVSHDRYFLDRVANKTVWLDGGKCAVFNGNYSFSVKEQERLLLLEFEQYKNQQKKIEAMRTAIKRYREWGAQGDNPKFFKKAHELEKRLEKLEVLDRPQLEKPKVQFQFGGGRTGREVLVLEDFSLAIGGKPLFQHAELSVYEKDKLCLIGGNGTGKTTLIRSILGQVPRQGGTQTLNPSVKMGYIPQEIRFEDEKDSVLNAFRKEHICSEGETRGILARFFFGGEAVFKRVGGLSGGEKVLLKLAALIQKEVNFLILDEPTNHIDIDLRETLEQALTDYTGTLLFVSHDRYFIDIVASRIVDVHGGGFRSFGAGYAAYRAQTLGEEEQTG